MRLMGLHTAGVAGSNPSAPMQEFSQQDGFFWFIPSHLVVGFDGKLFRHTRLGVEDGNWRTFCTREPFVSRPLLCC